MVSQTHVSGGAGAAVQSNFVKLPHGTVKKRQGAEFVCEVQRYAALTVIDGRITLGWSDSPNGPFLPARHEAARAWSDTVGAAIHREHRKQT